MKKLKKWFLNLSIQRKYLYCTLGITLVVLLATSFFQFMSASEIVTEQTVKQSAGVINELSVNLDHYFDMVENSFEYIANNSIVQAELESDEPYKSDGSELYSYYSRAGQIRRLLLQGYTSIYMNDIQLYGYNGANHLLSNDRGINEESSEISCTMAENANGRCVYYNAADENLIYMAKQIKDVLTMEPLGVLRASIKISYLKKMTLTAQESLFAHIFLLDQDNNILLESVGENKDLKDQKWVDQINGNSGNLRLNLDGKAYNLVYQTSSDTGLTVVGMIPTSFLQKTARELEKTTVLLIGISILLCVFLANIMARGITRPIERTSNAMKKFAKGDFSVRLPEERTDEIGAMNSVFNQTIEKIEKLLKQIVEMEMVNKDIEFQALQAQINPHFLYNVLDTINWMARKKGEENICRMVTAISNLMRASISNKRSMVRVKEELKYIEDYLFIQETRYGDKFTSYIEVDEELNELEIPKMVIQTLVENAVVHGVENATWDCFLYISGEVQDGIAVFKVKDGKFDSKTNEIKFELNGKTYELAANNGKNSLHGGIKGFNQKIFKYELLEDGIRFIYLSPDMEEGYPGSLYLKVVYRLCDNTLKMEYEAVSDQDTLINITNHSYFNLSAGKDKIYHHQLKVKADEIACVDENCLANGTFLKIENTPFDFKEFHEIGERINNDHEQLKLAGGYDHSFMVKDEDDQLVLYDKETGRKMTMTTTLPCIQVYTGNFLSGGCNGKGGKPYENRDGVALEAQFLPNSIHIEKEPKVILRKGEEYEAVTTYRFEVE